MMNIPLPPGTLQSSCSPDPLQCIRCLIIVPKWHACSRKLMTEYIKREKRIVLSGFVYLDDALVFASIWRWGIHMHGLLDCRIHTTILLTLACHWFHQKDALPYSWECVKVMTEEDMSIHTCAWDVVLQGKLIYFLCTLRNSYYCMQCIFTSSNLI